MQLCRGRGSTPSSPLAPSDHASPLSACPEALRTNSTLLSTTQSWKSVTGQLGSCYGRGPKGGAPSHLVASPDTQPLTCSLTASPAAPGWVSTFFLSSSV